MQAFPVSWTGHTVAALFIGTGDARSSALAEELWRTIS
jgi:hypothetical protein